MEKEIQALRRELFWMRIAGGVFALAVILAAAREAPSGGEIRARAFVVVDAAGKEWARLDKHPLLPVPTLDLFGTDGTTAMSVTGGVSPGFWATNKSRKVTCELKLSETGTALLSFKGSGAEALLSLGVVAFKPPIPSFQFQSAKQPLLDLFDDSGRPLFSVKPLP